ncbi:hypothetical protein ACBI99_44875 [Nonomuraea sp. ATR24]|uniref:hypothetical protein n=1 Tax=Nonomuraea sp. ATR24 TaxID=1676744 RepID=UPI0035BF7CEE
MSTLETIERIGPPQPGPIERRNSQLAGAILVGGRTMWLDRADMLALLNSAAAQLARMDEIDGRQAQHAQQEPPSPYGRIRPYVPAPADGPVPRPLSATDLMKLGAAVAAGHPKAVVPDPPRPAAAP